MKRYAHKFGLSVMCLVAFLSALGVVAPEASAIAVAPAATITAIKVSWLRSCGIANITVALNVNGAAVASFTDSDSGCSCSETAQTFTTSDSNVLAAVNAAGSQSLSLSFPANTAYLSWANIEVDRQGGSQQLCMDAEGGSSCGDTNFCDGYKNYSTPVTFSAPPPCVNSGPDCDHNGIADTCESSWANRDDDGDGVCNGVDNCPYEPNPDQSGPNGVGVVPGNACLMQAITVPWIPANPNVPHSTYAGATITLKGIARYGGDQYMWDFGDGSPVTAWTAIGDPYNLGVNHVYTGNVGQLFIATLSVRTAANPAVVATAAYPVKFQLSSDLTDPNQMDVRVNVAIDQGLWYLHVNQSRSTYADSAPGYMQRYGYWSNAKAASCAALDALELHGSKPQQTYSTDPYVEDTQRVLGYLLAGAKPAPVSVQPAGNPDVNGNGIGIYFSTDDTYTDGICGAAFASSGAPGRQALTGKANVYGRLYSDIAQDVVDWFAYGQVDSGYARGGWYYSANSNGADGSTNQWPILAIGAAEDNMGATVPAFVRSEIPFFLNYIHNTNQDAGNGGWGYTSATMWPNIAKTAGGMLGHYFLGDSVSQPDVQAGLGFMYRHWGSNTDGWADYSSGNSYAMYGTMKAMRKPQPNILRITEYDYVNKVATGNSFDWYYTPKGQAQEGLATNLTKRQNGDGSWNDTFGNNAMVGTIATAWDTLILSKAVTSIPPQAAICNCSATWSVNSDVTLDGSCSSDNDLSRHIRAYDWDFAYNGTKFNQSLDAYGYGVTGVKGIKVGGFPAYTEAANGVPNGTTFPIALRVTDDNPISQGGAQTSIATCNVVIKPPPHCPQVTAGGPSTGGPYLGSVNVPVQLDASKSFDVDHDPITYAWDFKNNGLFTDATGVSPTVTYSAPGIYPIAVTGTDHPELNAVPYVAADCPVIAYTTIEIGSHTPIADAGGPYTILANSTITLDASRSTDPDNLAITYAWDLTGNGKYNDSTLQKPGFSVGSVAPPTAYSVCVKVSNGTKIGTACSTVTVLKARTPPVCTIVSPQVVASCTGGPVPVAIDGSHSYDLNGDPITFAWTSDCPVAFDNATSKMPSLTFQTANNGCMSGCTAHLTVANAYLSSTCDAKIAIVDNNAPVFSAGVTPANVSFECDPNTTAKVTAWLANAGATDVCSAAGAAPVSLSNDFQPSASCGGVGVGKTVKVTWTAQNGCANSSTGQSSATVTITDHTPPVLTLPASATAAATGPLGATVSFVTSALDFVSGSTAVICTPASGSTFAVGSTTVTCTSTDAAGNTASGTLTVVVYPPVPTILTPKSGAVIVASGATGGPVQTLATGVPGATLNILDATDHSQQSIGPADASGNFSGAPPFTYGEHLLTFTQTIAGQTSAATAQIRIDVVPSAPVISQPTSGGAYVANGLGGGGVVLQGRGVPGATLTLFDGGVASSQQILVGVDGSFSASITLTYGTHQLSFNQTFAGETSATSVTLTVNVVPAPPVVIAPYDGFMTTNTAVALVATGAANANLDGFNGAQSLPAFTSNALGSYSGSYTLDYGPHVLTWQQMVSGETSATTSAAHIDVIPPAPSFSTPVSGFRTTADLAVLVSGSAVAGLVTGDAGIVHVFEVLAGGNQLLGAVPVAASGTFAQAFSFASGTHTLLATESLNSESSALSTTTTFTVRPPAPSITTEPSLVDNHAAFTGASFVAATSTTITAYDGATAIYTTTASTTGAWSFDGLAAPRLLPDGLHNLSFSATNNGQESDKVSYSFMLWTQVPRLTLTPAPGSMQTTASQPLAYAYAPDYAPPAGVYIANVAYTSDGAALYSGAPAGAPAFIDLTMALPGAHTVTLLAVDNLGNADVTPFSSTYYYGPSLETDIALTTNLLGPLAITCGDDEGGSCDDSGCSEKDGHHDCTGHDDNGAGDDVHHNGNDVHHEGDGRHECDGDHGDGDHGSGDDGHHDGGDHGSGDDRGGGDHGSGDDGHHDGGDTDSAACRAPHLSLGQYKFLLSRLVRAQLELAKLPTAKHPDHVKRKAVRLLWSYIQAVTRDVARGRIPAAIGTVLIADVRYLVDQLGGPPRSDDDGKGDD